MTKQLATVLTLAVIATACDEPHPTLMEVENSQTFSAAKAGGGNGNGAALAANIVDATNALLEVQGSDYRIAWAEYYTDPGSGVSGNIIIAKDVGNKRLGFDFIPGDPRRGGIDGDPNTIDVLIDQVDGATASGLAEATTTAAITRAMATWNAQTCSDPAINVLPVPFDLGLVQAALGFGGGLFSPDIIHAGWLPGSFFETLVTGGGTSILGITFTIVFSVGDLDGNGLPDLAGREIYYNDAFVWADDGVSNVDVETVALHEAGHGLSQGHFGTIFINLNAGKIQFAPLAVMNAAYSGPQRSLRGTDEAGHCGLWGSWPNN
jgi:hypothetical protein